MSVRKARSIIRKITGFDIHRYKPAKDLTSWLQALGIRTVFDIGANTGQFAAEIRNILPGAMIYSFEPLKDCFLELRERESKDTRFKAFNLAIGDKEGTLEIHKSAYAPSSSILPMTELHKESFPHSRGSVPETISIKKLDDAVKSISIESELLIKADVQGYEDKVILGGRETFLKAKAVIIETSFVPLYEGQPLFDDIYGSLKTLGFSYRGSINHKSGANGERLFEDSLFVRE